MRCSMLGEPFEWSQHLVAIHFESQLKLEGFGPPDDFSLVIESKSRIDGPKNRVIVDMSRNELENLAAKISVRLQKLPTQKPQ